MHSKTVLTEIHDLAGALLILRVPPSLDMGLDGMQRGIYLNHDSFSAKDFDRVMGGAGTSLNQPSNGLPDVS